MSSKVSGPASQPVFMDQSTRPPIKGVGRSARWVPWLENPVLGASASHGPSDPWWKQVKEQEYKYVFGVCPADLKAQKVIHVLFIMFLSSDMSSTLIWKYRTCLVSKMQETAAASSDLLFTCHYFAKLPTRALIWSSNTEIDHIWWHILPGALTFWSCPNLMTSWPFTSTLSSSTALYAPLETPEFAMLFAVMWTSPRSFMPFRIPTFLAPCALHFTSYFFK